MQQKPLRLAWNQARPLESWNESLRRLRAAERAEATCRGTNPHKGALHLSDLPTCSCVDWFHGGN